MEISFNCVVPCEIRMEPGAWSSLRVSRVNCMIQIEKPVSRGDAYLAASFLMQAQQGMPAHFDTASAFTRKSSVIRITADAEQIKGTADVVRFFDKCLRETIRDLLTWIRVETLQYWVGYYESSVRTLTFTYSNRDGSVANRNPCGVGSVFQYGHPLTEGTWLSFGDLLARAATPKPSRRFFCDALLDISEWDITQSIVSLGVCCEIECRDLVSNLLLGKSPEIQKMYERYAKRNSFDDAIGPLMEILGAQPFETCDPRAAQLVKELYRGRGTAVHAGLSGFEQKGGQVLPAALAAMAPYVDAVKKLFAWADSQRARMP